MGQSSHGGIPMFSRVLRTSIQLILAACALTVALVAQQDARGTITGRVVDSSGAVVIGADIRATNQATGTRAVTKSNDAGNYVLAYLLSGVYTVEVDAAMELGSQTGTVQVTPQTPLLRTADASVGRVVDQRRIQDLQTFGGAPYNLVLMASGAVIQPISGSATWGLRRHKATSRWTVPAGRTAISPSMVCPTA